MNKELKLYNYDYKKIKLPSNPYSQLLVHNVTSTFSDKRRDRYEVRIVFLSAKNCGFTTLALNPCGPWM